VTSRSAYRDYHFKKADRPAGTTCSSTGHNVLNSCVFIIDSIEGLKARKKWQVTKLPKCPQMLFFKL